MYSETPQLQPIVPAYHLRILSDGQVDQLQAATLEILEEVGIHCPSERALNIFAEGTGFRDPLEVAREKTDWILEHHHPEPLDGAQQAELKRILQAAGRELAG